jgi:NADH pyrophosphatase NudC (nudix superfamily)
LVKRFSMWHFRKIKNNLKSSKFKWLACNKNLNANLHTKRFCSHCRRRGLAGIYQVSRSNSRNEKRNRD